MKRMVYGLVAMVLFFDLAGEAMAARVITFEKNFGGTDRETGYYTKQTADGGYMVVGTVYDTTTGMEDILLLKTDAYGNLAWQKTFGGTDRDIAYSGQQTSDGNYIAAGFTASFGDGGDVYLVKTDAGGNLQWSKTHGGLQGDSGECVSQTTDGGYIVVGGTYSLGINGDVYLIKTKSNGK